MRTLEGKFWFYKFYNEKNENGIHIFIYLRIKFEFKLNFYSNL